MVADTWSLCMFWLWSGHGDAECEAEVCGGAMSCNTCEVTRVTCCVKSFDLKAMGNVGSPPKNLAADERAVW